MTLNSLLIVLALTLQSIPQEPQAVVRELLNAEVAGDEARARVLFADPQTAFAYNEVRRMHLRCSQLIASDVAVTAISEDEATIDESHTTAVSSSLANSVPALRRSSSRVVLKKTAAGWRIVKRTSLEKELLDQWAAATTDDARAALIAASPQLLNETFVSAADVTVRRLTNEGRRPESLALANLASRIADQLGDPRSIAEAAVARAVAIRAQLPRDAAVLIQVSQESVQLAEVAGDPDVLARALLRHARAMEDTTARLDKAALERAIPLRDEVEDLSTSAHVSIHYARALEAENRTRDAFRYAWAAAKYAEEANEASAKLSAALMLGAAYMWTSDVDLAIRQFQRAIELARAANYQGVEAFAYSSLASALQISGDVEGATRVAEEGVQRFSGEVALPIMRNHMALLIERGRYEDAERDLHKMKEVAANSTEATKQIAALELMLNAERGNYEAALKSAREALTGFASTDAAARFLEAHALRCLGRSDEAIEILDQIVTARRDAPSTEKNGSPELQLFVARGDRYDDLLVSLLVEQGQIARAFEVSEIAKAGLLREALDANQLHLTISPADQERQKALEARVETLNRALVARKYTEQEAAELSVRMEDARADLREFHQRLHSQEPAAAAQYATIGIDDLPSRLDDTTIITYLQTREQTFVFAAEPKNRGQRRMAVRIVPIPTDALNRKVSRFVDLVEQRNLRANAAAAELYQLLLAPIAQSIDGAKSICIIPDRRLWGIPFHALRDRNERVLLERVPVFYAPSIAALAAAEIRRRELTPHKNRTLLAFANPTVASETAAIYRVFRPGSELGAIPEAETEVRRIASIYSNDASRVYVGAAARESVFKREADSSDILHIASHGLVQDNAPMFSSILFAKPTRDEGEDGLLEVREILELHLNADLAVLSACDTGRASNIVGRGLVGMSWSFLAAGCPTTVVSLWSAQSAATSDLMVAFHHELHAGRSKPEALRAAQLKLRRDPRYQHMFYWAAFVSIGAP